MLAVAKGTCRICDLDHAGDGGYRLAARWGKYTEGFWEAPQQGHQPLGSVREGRLLDDGSRKD